MTEHAVAIIGAGPAGLTAAYLLAKQRVPLVVFEADPQYVGGISKTVTYKGFHFDIGGHRFFSKSQEIEDLWTELLGDDMLTRPRSSRIFYRGQFFSYPLKGREALLKLGIVESILCVLSYLKARLLPKRNPANFEEWVSNKFGKRLFSIFFKTYTEKVWGMSCQEISADWAAQRIKGLSLSAAIWAALWPKDAGTNSKQIKTLIESFRYPRKGPGMMWEACAEKVKAMGGLVKMGSCVTKSHYAADEKLWKLTVENSSGASETFTATHVISSTPIRQLAGIVSPPFPEAVAEAAGALRYRDFITVVLMLKERNLFSDNWIYVHEPNVKVGRIQNFKSWSPEMVPDPALACYGLEYFCFEGDGLWNSNDEDLITLAKAEIEELDLAQAGDFVDGCVVRQQKAYPVYDDHYAAHVAKVRTEINRHFPTLHLVGRNGMHKYNNQDHSMMTAILTAKNILANEMLYDVWNVNEDAEYHETVKEGEQPSVSGVRMVPRKVTT